MQKIGKHLTFISSEPYTDPDGLIMTFEYKGEKCRAWMDKKDVDDESAGFLVEAPDNLYDKFADEIEWNQWEEIKKLFDDEYKKFV